jgi:hypothetical protein
MRWLCLALISIGLAGCSLNQAEPKTALVQQVEQAGAGDLSKASTGAIQQWLAKHGELAKAVDRSCRPIREKATANWADGTEGRLCEAARSVTAFSDCHPPRDDKKY